MNKNEITTASAQALTINEDEAKNKALEYLRSMGNNLPQKTQEQFIEIAGAFGLNPFKREIYCIGYGSSWNVVTGYEVYIKRAERLGKLDGWEVSVNGSGEQLSAQVTIYRKDWSHPFKHVVYYSEAVNKNKDGRPNSTWAKMPIFMTKKVAIAQAFRLCFPDEFGGMPYTSDELPEAEKTTDERNVTPAEKPASAPAPKVEKPAKKDEPKIAPKPAQAEALEVGQLMSENASLFTDAELEDFRNIYRAQGAKVALELIKKSIALKKPAETPAPATENNAEVIGDIF